MAQQLQVRNPPPRMLTEKETLQSLNHWKTAFRTYYRRDSYYKCFLLPAAVWDHDADNYGQTPDMAGANVVRTAEDKAGDLEDFLNIIAGYLPFPYLTQKIVKVASIHIVQEQNHIKFVPILFRYYLISRVIVY